MNPQKIDKPIQDLLEIFKKNRGDSFGQEREEPKVKIHESVGRMAFVYEKIRNAIDYQEEHLIRKNAIARMLKRRIISKERGLDIAGPLLRELVRAGYLKNNYFPLRRLPDIENMIAKYLALLQYSSTQPWFGANKKNFGWIMNVAAYEIEEYLSPSIKDDSLVEAMYKIIRPYLEISDEVPDPADQDIQIYIAIHRALIKSDPAILRYHLLYYYAPEWRYITSEEIPAFSQKLAQLMPHIDQQINSKISDRLFRFVRKFAPLFIALKDALNQNIDQADNMLTDPAKLEAAIRQACQKRYIEANAKLTRGIVRSIIYIFLTKTVLAFVLELPYETIFLKAIRPLPLVINVLFHPILMFLIATMIRVPAEKNTQMIVAGVMEIVYNPPEKKINKAKEQTLRSSPVLNVIFTFFYLLAFIITFGGIIWLLHTLEFSLVSGFLFIFFLSVISFFGLRLRHNAMELVVYTKRENWVMIIFDFLSLPILRAGRWIAQKTSKVNIFMFIMDFIIEAPFKVLIETIEDWLAFQRQKKEEII